MSFWTLISCVAVDTCTTASVFSVKKWVFWARGSTRGAATNAHPIRARGQRTDPAKRALDHAPLLWHRSVGHISQSMCSPKSEDSGIFYSPQCASKESHFSMDDNIAYKFILLCQSSPKMGKKKHHEGVCIYREFTLKAIRLLKCFHMHAGCVYYPH